MITIDASLKHDDGCFILFQEQVADQKEELGDQFVWAIACGSVVLQRTRREQAFPVIESLLNEWSPLRCANDQPWSFRQLVSLLKPSGLPEVKALRIAHFSREFLIGNPPDHWSGLNGYTRDSTLIFTDGKYLTYHTALVPEDRHLRDYVLRWRALKSVQRLTEGTAAGEALDDRTHCESSSGRAAGDLRVIETTDMKE